MTVPVRSQMTANARWQFVLVYSEPARAKEIGFYRYLTKPVKVDLLTETLEELPPGQPGLIQLQTPYLTSYPSHSLLTTDLGTLTPGCHCGLPGPVLTILGRGGVKKHKGCAITASETLLRA